MAIDKPLSISWKEMNNYQKAEESIRQLTRAKERHCYYNCMSSLKSLDCPQCKYGNGVNLTIETMKKLLKETEESNG